MGEGAERNLCAGGRARRRCSQGVGILLEFGLHFQDHVVLVELRENGRDLALAEGVVERVVDRLRSDAEARGGIAIDDQIRSPSRRSAGRWRRRAVAASACSLSTSARVQVFSSLASASSRVY